jgi:hypothetical protein
MLPQEAAMKNLPRVVICILVVCCGLAGCMMQSRSQPSGWITLFDGSNLSQWDTIGDANWRLADGAVVADKGKSGFLVSKESFGDFEIRAEFWVSDDANSGVFLRCSDRQMVDSKNAYEVNIYDQRPDPSYGTGAIVDVAKPSVMLKAGGHWNTYDITARGDRFYVSLNGVRTVEGAQSGKHANGPISLQYAGGVVKFRKVEIKPL